MDLKQIEKLIALMGRTGMKRIVIKQEGFEVELERETPLYAVGAVSLPSLPPIPSHAPVEHVTPSTFIESQPGQYVVSPMVGTFYASSSPVASPFVKVGDKVEEETVVGIIEAMKVMNEIKAGVKGVVSETLVKSGEPVEFGTKLLKIT